MQNNYLEFSIRQNIKHAPSVLHGLENVQQNQHETGTNQQDTVDTIGGIFRDGSLGWIVAGSHIEVVSLKNGNKIADYTFGGFGDRRYKNTFIAFVTEVSIDRTKAKLLAIGVHSSPTTSCVYLFAVNGSQIIHAIEIEEKLTSCSFIEPHICADSALDALNGCIIVGAESGRIVIVDLFADSCLRVLNGSAFYHNEPKLCKIVSSDEFQANGLVDESDDFCFGLRLDDIADVRMSGSVLSILCLQPLLVVAVGYEDGKLLLYDLCTLAAFHIAYPPDDDSPLEKLTFIEPSDDPRACVYIWSFHSNSSNAFAVLHSLTYETKILKPNGNGFVYKNFERCTPRLTMPIFEKNSRPIACQSITKFIAAEDNLLTLCLLSWVSSSGAFVCLFDLNQWYKQQLPDTCDWRSSPTFLAIFPLGKQSILDVWMNGLTVTPFSSLNRPEEHFYPSSLSFDCTVLTTNGSAKLHWLGLQNEALEHLNQNGPYAILEPNRCFADMVRASLIPQFTDYSYDMNQSLKSKREFLLSIALEYNCVNLLKRCANAWADGSHLSKSPYDGMSLSTLTDWIWNRATSIKDCCNEMCIPLFDHSGNSIEPRSQKALLNFSRQLKRLFQLMDMIVTTHQKYIPGQVLDTLKSQRNSISMATEYQEVLQWLLNIGLLPEVHTSHPQSRYSQYRDSSFDDFLAIPYPYEALKSYYQTQRRKYGDINPEFLVPATKSCRILYIDAFIENECNSAVLRSEWRKGFGDGLYPPSSLQAMLRTLLVPGVPTERKFMLFVYLFMDLSTVLREERYEGVIKNLIKFPAVFKMDPGFIKITQAFWNLDHGEYELAIEEIISPLAQDQNMSVWQRELLIGALLINDVPHLALRALHAPGSPISPSLEIRTLLANDLVTDAFQVQRMKRNRNLLFEFFQGCHEQRKWHYLLNLSLNDKEEECLGEFLRSIESSLGEHIHFIYLLRRCKYLEAVTFIDDLHQKKRSGHLDLDTPNTILSTYRLTMAPSIRKFCDLYYAQRDDINVKLNSKANCPKPLSTQLSQNAFAVGGGVYHQSLIHTEQTSVTYWENQESKMCGIAPSNVPFLYGVRVNPSPNNSFDDRVCYPEPFVPTSKRRFNESFGSGVQGPAAKRQRTDTSNVINSTLLTSFKPSAAHHSQSLAKSSNDSIEMDDTADVVQMQTTLSTPVVQSQRTDKKASFALLDRIGTPLSILKSRSSYHTSSAASRRSVDSDDRSIRFTLPNDDDTVVASTPVAGEAFCFGIHSRPSIHSERSPSKLVLGEKNVATLTTSTKSATGDCKTIHTTSPGRKRLRSISPEELSMSNVTTCIDVSIEQPSMEPQSNQLYVSSEECSEREAMEDDDDKGSDSEDVAESINKSQYWLRSATAETLPQQNTDIDEPTPAEESIPPLPTRYDRTQDRTIDQYVSMTSQLLLPVPTKEQTQPVERIIPIEIEPRTEPASTSKPIYESTPLLRENRLKGRPSIGLNVFSTGTPKQRNIFTDSDLHESSYEKTLSDETFKPRNLFTSTITEASSHSTNTTAVADHPKTVASDEVIETVQIDDSDDSDSIACDAPETVETEAIVTENTTKAPTTSLASESVQFGESSHNFSFHRKNILTDSTIKDATHYNYSTWEQSTVFQPKNILTDSTYKEASVTNAEQSTLNAAEDTTKVVIEASAVAGGGSDGNPIDVIDITEPVVLHSLQNKDSNSPAFNDEHSNDIYDLSSEVDAATRDDDYDVDDYESESEDDDDDNDDVIDISSGTEDVADPPPLTAKSPKTDKVTLPPITTLGRVADLSRTTDAIDESIRSDTSFMTASENNSMRYTTLTTALERAVESIQPTEKEVTVGQPEIGDVIDEQMNDQPLPTSTSDYIGVMDVDQYEILHLDQNQVTITYELQEQLFATDENAPNYTVEYAADSVTVSEMNNAILPSESTIAEQLMEVEPEATLTEASAEVTSVTETADPLNDAVIDVQDTIATVTESRCEVTEEKSDEVTVVDNAVTPADDESVAANETEPTSSACDLNAAVISDTATQQEISESLADTLVTDQKAPDSLVDAHDESMTEATSDDLNKAILGNESGSQVAETDPVTEATHIVTEDSTTATVGDSQQTGAVNEQNEEVNLDIDEMLETAVVPETQKDEKEEVQPENDEVSVAPSASIAEGMPKRRLRSNSGAVDADTPPVLRPRRRSSSLLPTELSTPDTPVTSTRTTRARSEVKTPSTPAGTTAKRGARAKSELKTSSDEQSSTAAIEPEPDSIPKKVKRAASRDVNSPVADSSTTTRVLRSRAQSIAEDDDNVSIVSEVSVKSSVSKASRASRARSTRAKSLADGDSDIDDSPATTAAKKSRLAKQPNILPVISEDLSQDGVGETQAYGDARRLTRTQKKFMERAAEAAKMVAPPPARIARKRQRKNSTADADDDDISDTASVASSKTNASVRSRKSTENLTPVRQSKRLKEREGSAARSVASKDSDTESVVSVARSTRSRRSATSRK